MYAVHTRQTTDDVDDGVIWLSKWIKQALTTAQQSRTAYRHAALVVRDGRLVGAGVPRRVGPAPTSDAGSWRRSYQHAEFIALSRAQEHAHGADLYVARLDARGSPAMSRPCRKCLGLARRAGIRRVVWTTADDIAQERVA